jgi:hypothetical protein
MKTYRSKYERNKIVRQVFISCVDSKASGDLQSRMKCFKSTPAQKQEKKKKRRSMGIKNPGFKSPLEMVD